MADNVPGIDFRRLTPWFREHVKPVRSLSARIIGHGRSNLTYRLESDEGEAWVLRRPPLSHVLPTAHDMKREFRVISALQGRVPVPRPIALCEDTSVNDAPFYIMSFVEGMVPADPVAFKEKFPEPERRRIGEALIDTLVDLHAVKPDEVGLADFGKPQGFIERQVRRFAGQIEQHKTRDVPELEELARRLAAAIPADRGDYAIVHGDYRIDNCVLADDGSIAAVLDWEMATLGDPLADVGLIIMYWAPPPGETAATGVASNSVTGSPGFLTRDEAIARYAERSGRTLENIDFYIVLAHFKLAVIVEGIYARFLKGGTVGEGFEGTGVQAQGLARAGLALADRSSIAALRG